MAAEIQVEIVTPFGKVYHTEADSCIIPGALGQFQIMKDHASMIAAVEIGAITVNLNGDEIQRIATSGGFCEVKDNNVSVMLESAELDKNIDVERARSAKARAEERLSSDDADIDYDRARLALARALNRLKIAQHQ